MVDIGHVTHMKPKVWEIRRAMFTVKGLVWSLFFQGLSWNCTINHIHSCKCYCPWLWTVGGDLIYFSRLKNGVCRERYSLLIELQYVNTKAKKGQPISITM